jgi:hypothetical protein
MAASGDSDSDPLRYKLISEKDKVLQLQPRRNQKQQPWYSFHVYIVADDAGLC